jgi:hypothetical protein
MGNFIYQTTDPNRKPAEPAPRSMREFTRPEVKKRYGWTDAQLNEATAFEPVKFPRHNKGVQLTSWRDREFWYEWQLEEWERDLRGHFAHVHQLFKKVL